MLTEQFVEEWTNWKQRVHYDGLEKGRAEEAARAVLTVLRVRGIAVSDAARERILAQKDLKLLERWHERAIVASSVEEAFMVCYAEQVSSGLVKGGGDDVAS